MTTYVIAVGETPTIVCPPWCDETQEYHIAELENWDGRCLHRGRRASVGLVTIDIVDTTNADGTREDGEVDLGLIVGGQQLTITHADELVRQLQAAIDELRPWAERP